MEKTFISKCCKAEVKYIENFNVYECSKCHNWHTKGGVEEVCAHCLGTGEVSSMEQVYPNEPHRADIGTQKCVCQIEE